MAAREQRRRASFLVAGLHGGNEEVNTVTALACRLEERPCLSLSLVEGFRDDLRISDLLGAPQQLVTVLKRTLPQKMNARLAANLEDAMMKSIATGEMYVTLNGDWIASDSSSTQATHATLKKGQDYSLSNESCASLKHARKCWRGS